MEKMLELGKKSGHDPATPVKLPFYIRPKKLIMCRYTYRKVESSTCCDGVTNWPFALKDANSLLISSMDIPCKIIKLVGKTSK